MVSMIFSRELVAQVALACATTPGLVGLTIDVMDGKEAVERALENVVVGSVDAWME